MDTRRAASKAIPSAWQRKPLRSKSISPYDASATEHANCQPVVLQHYRGSLLGRAAHSQGTEDILTTTGDGDDDDELAWLHLLETEEHGHPEHSHLLKESGVSSTCAATQEDEPSAPK